MADWEGLPSELLLKIAGLCPNPAELLGVCKTWKEGLEGCITSLEVQPSLPLNLAARFPSLTFVDLKYCIGVTPEVLSQSLGALSKVTLSLNVVPEDITPAMAAALRALELHRLHVTSPFSNYIGFYVDSTLSLLEGLPISKLELDNMRVSDNGMAALRGMPLVELWLGGSFLDSGLAIALEGKALTSLAMFE